MKFCVKWFLHKFTELNYGLWWLCEEKTLVKKTNGESESSNESDIEASGDAVLIRDGLCAIAEAIAQLAQVIKTQDSEQQDYGDPQQQEFYIDGAPIKK